MPAVPLNPAAIGYNGTDYWGPLFFGMDYFGTGSVLTAPAPPVAGTLTTNGMITSSFVPLRIATNAGGTAPYSNQLQRVASGAGWTSPVNIGSPVVGATANFADSTVSPLTSYDYRVIVTDSASGTVNSNTYTVTIPSSEMLFRSFAV